MEKCEVPLKQGQLKETAERESGCESGGQGGLDSGRTQQYGTLIIPAAMRPSPEGKMYRLQKPNP